MADVHHSKTSSHRSLLSIVALGAKLKCPTGCTTWSPQQRRSSSLTLLSFPMDSLVQLSHPNSGDERRKRGTETVSVEGSIFCHLVTPLVSTSCVSPSLYFQDRTDTKSPCSPMDPWTAVPLRDSEPNLFPIQATLPSPSFYPE